MASKKLIDSTLSALDFALKGRNDFFLTTSFGYQSSLLFFLMAELGVSMSCLYVKSNLSSGGIEEQIDYAINKFDIDLTMVDRSDWLDTELRGQEFLTIEEPKDLPKVIKDDKTYLVDCVSMWLFNNLEKDEKTLKEQLKTICSTKANIVFVLNDVSCGVIPFDSQSRRFVDFSGLIGQELVKLCDEVYEVKYSISKRLK